MRRRLAVAVALLTWAVAACASILGIEELPLLEEHDASDAAMEEGDAAAEAAPCDDDISLGCRGCPHAFCDDFDDDAAPGARWISTVTPSGGPLFIQRGDGGATGALVTDGAVSPPFAFESSVASDAGGSFSLLLNQLAKHTPGPRFAGLVYRFQLRVRRLELTEIEGPLKHEDSGSAAFAALSPADITSAAVGLVSTQERVFAVLGTNFFQPKPDASIHDMFATELATFGDQPVRMDIYVTTRERALAEKLVRCGALAAPTVMAVRVNNVLHECAPLEGPLADLAWTHDAVIGLGAGTFGSGSVAIVYDNVMVDFLE